MNLGEKIKLYGQLEKEILEELDALESSGCECSCDDTDAFKYINEDGEWDENRCICTNCGGYIEESEWV